MRVLPALMLIATGILNSGPQAGAAGERPLDRGFWVILGSFPTEPWTRQADDSKRINAAAGRCGFRTHNDFSDKFRGFAPGYNVFVIGAYASRAEADGVARSVRPCVPGAYVKYGDYAGE